MATKKTSGAYVVVRDFAMPGAAAGEQGRIALAGETVDMDDTDAALLVRDGMIRPA
jgi:fermentation-respiration switch protein FrsA (DUF1100 family)